VFNHLLRRQLHGKLQNRGCRGNRSCAGGEISFRWREGHGYVVEQCAYTSSAQGLGREDRLVRSACAEVREHGRSLPDHLYRINGVGSEYAELLEVAGVDTVPELATRNAANLTQAMAAVNQEKKLTRQVPTESEVMKWIEQAKGLPRMLQH
jgi:predicted flap endonuclease-1-like 5' DNA nuclease